jgi:adenine-specific DNA-methyltransferase
MKNHKIKGESYISQKELAEALKINFPSVFSDGKVDPEKLKLALGEACQLANEHYGLSWAGKSS